MSHRPLKVLYVTHTAARGGCAASLRYLIENLPPGSVEATVLSPAGPAAEAFRKAGARVITISGVSMLLSLNGGPLRGWRNLELLRTAWALRSGREIRAAIRDVRPDIVHLNERGMLQAARIAHRDGIPVIVHARSVVDRKTRWVKAIGELALNRYASLVVPIDESVSWSLREVRRRQVVYNPLNVSDAELAAATATRVPDPDGNVRVTYLSGLLVMKGIWDLLEAAKRLRHRRDIVFQIAGENSRPPEFFRSPVGKMASLAGLARDIERDVRAWLAREGLTNVRLLGHVDTPATLLAATDILVFPSRLNGPGRSVFEAGIYGIPSVLALADKVEDVVTDGVTGLIVPERDPAALAAAIERLAQDEALRRRMGEEARRRYLVQFNPKRIGEQMFEIYRDVLAPQTETHTASQLEPA